MKTVVIRGQQKWEHFMIQRKAEATLLEALNEAAFGPVSKSGPGRPVQ